MSYWREKAKEVIDCAVSSASVGMNMKNLRQCGGQVPWHKATAVSETQKKELRLAIDAAYPFGVRKNHPYQQWWGERRKAFDRLGLAQSEGRKKPAINCDPTVPGQTSIFDLL
ncbi:hypothetical protein [Dendronalium sp. ChiSLP03b]|uniref:hypothetical protein n=1 Tax=Dendronalium sp. ChiSLP03b TaxID=3075381 RepID=UPI00391CAC03